MPPEAAAREKIDALLVAAGWAILNYQAFNPATARASAFHEVPPSSGWFDYPNSVEPLFRDDIGLHPRSDCASDTLPRRTKP